MRKPRERTDYIVLHTALTFDDQHVDAKTIRKWHMRRGWDDIGYHLVILRDGSLEWGRPLHHPGAHTRGYNHCSVGIVLAGGLAHLPDPPTSVNQDKIYEVNGKPVGIMIENYTGDQWETLRHTVHFMKALYPDALVVGHRDLTKDGRYCPGFSAPEWWSTVRDLGVA